MMRPSGTFRRTLPVLGALIAAMAFVAPPSQAVALPAAPTIISPAASGVVTSTFVLTGRVGPEVTEVRVEGAVSASVTLSPTDSEGATFTARVHVKHRRTELEVRASDGTDWSPAKTLVVWKVGSASARTRFVLVDKSDFMLYVVRWRTVIAAYPIAIGTYATPTPTGRRYLGRPVHAPNGAWGPFRMRLYREAWVRVAYRTRVGGRVVTRHHKVLRKVGTKYYIHGTNNPDSIGTPASHGCVRLWNSRLRLFRKLTYKYELTVIRH
jgi:lipoprotein-anchoring transpeptidase ErfK/SrfK